jgi:DNA (cytosine-5)-methyltransferase 1
MMHISLFSGIGGFELAAEWSGWRNIASCEINEFGRKVLEHYWPDAYHHDDIHTFTYERLNDELTRRYGAGWRSDDIILTGGFPCQDASNAKQDGEGQKGIRGERTGLVYEMLRIIGEVKPKYIVAENVAHLYKINQGKDFGFILGELATLGYHAEWRTCMAAEVGAPHKRQRIYLVAYPSGKRLSPGESFFTYAHKKVSQKRRESSRTASSVGLQWHDEPQPYCLDDGVPEGLDTSSISRSKWRNESIKAYGNAIVPQVAYQIFKAIQQYEDQQ